MIKYILYYPILFISTISFAQNNSIPLSDITTLGKYTGKTVTITGTISKIMWSHIVAPPKEYPIIEYFDSGNSQIVIYLKKITHCDGSVRITGKVIKIKGASSQKGSSLESKAEGITEYHMAVDTCECIE
jgi:hypothetical protein